MGVPLKPKFENLPTELQAVYVAQAERVRQFCGFIVAGHDDASVKFDILLGKTLQQIEMRGMMQLLVEKGIITGEEFTRKSIASMQAYLTQMETVHEVEIRIDGVVSTAPPPVPAPTPVDEFEPGDTPASVAGKND
jgi:hypothetical protein